MFPRIFFIWAIAGVATLAADSGAVADVNCGSGTCEAVDNPVTLLGVGDFANCVFDDGETYFVEIIGLPEPGVYNICFLGDGAKSWVYATSCTATSERPEGKTYIDTVPRPPPVFKVGDYVNCVYGKKRKNYMVEITGIPEPGMYNIYFPSDATEGWVYASDCTAERPLDEVHSYHNFHYVVWEGNNAHTFEAAFRMLFNSHEWYGDDDELQRQTVFTYFSLDDTFGTPYPNSVGDFKRVIHVIERSVTLRLNSKAGMYRLLIDAVGRDKIFDKVYPRFYLSTDDAIAALERENKKDKLVLVKDSAGTRGIGIDFVFYADLLALRERQMQGLDTKTYVIEEAIEDQDLLDGQKYDTRYYIFFHNGKMYLHEVVFNNIRTGGAKFVKNSTDATNHILAHGPMTFFEMKKRNPNAKHIWQSIYRNLQVIYPVFKFLMDHTAANPDSYHFYGGDALVLSNLDVRFLEFNDYPNLARYGTSLMLRDVIAITMDLEKPAETGFVEVLPLQEAAESRVSTSSSL